MQTPARTRTSGNVERDSANAETPALRERSERPDRKTASPLERLTDREKDVLLRLARGLTNKQIAGELNLALNSIRVYTTRVFMKCGISRRGDAARVVA